jgi:hypothetical protein
MWRLALCLILCWEGATMAAELRTPQDEPLLDWTEWQTYRATVQHPAGVIKTADVARARENIQRYDWARKYLSSIQASATGWLPRLTAEYLEQMIPETTPGDTGFTPCPACRDQGKPAHPHGQWQWDPGKPDVVTCQVCKTVFPNDQYPESIVLTTTWGKPQKLSFYGGKGFTIFSYFGRPSFTGYIRARKVGYMAGAARTLAEAYLLTGDPEFADATRRILVRLAQVYPNWLVHVGYGEYADMDPHIAALNISNLPADELCPGPTRPDRKLHTGYWSAGRSSATGMDAGFVRQMVEAYDFTCTATRDGKPIYSDEERLKIEHDLLLESTVLLVADKSVNNKSVGNATAVALVGMVLGHPRMVRFGLDNFLDTVNNWFLPDGGTSESWAYASMTLGGIVHLGQAFRGYSDPPGYTDAEGKRLEKFDLYHDTNYHKAWQAMFDGLQGDLRYPPLADSYRSTGLNADFVEYMVANYPDKPEYLALLREIAGPQLTGGSTRAALYSREPGLENKPAPALQMRDFVFPNLQIGTLRSGETGRDSALVLSASDWGGHHHYDSLSLYYWQKGHELLSDLGYLWDHPMKPMTTRSFAHNTVMVDGQEQAGRGRGGNFTLLATEGPIKVMEAESTAYPKASLYRRTVAQVEHATGRQYVADIFRVQGGRFADYVFHGPATDPTIEGPGLQPGRASDEAVPAAPRLWINAEGALIQVDDVQITDPDGDAMFANSAVTQVDSQTGKPVGFGYYSGDGTAEWGRSADGHGDASCAYLKGLRAGGQGLNQALLLGNADGYRGVNATRFVPGVRYKVTFWIKGNAPTVQGSVVYWPGDPSDPGNRAYTELRGATALPVGPEWQKVEAEFRIPGGVDLENLKVSDAAADWHMTWKMGDGFAFSALWSDPAGCRTMVGDGWGQRDYRNSDVGATLPYIVRRSPGSNGPTVFVTAFEGYVPGQALVKSIRALPVSDGDRANTVAVEVQTQTGTDFLVSSLEARSVRLDLPVGTLETDGRFAVVSLENGAVTRATLVEGTTLRLNGQSLNTR